MPSECTICVLCYGPHEDLARRCLTSLQRANLTGIDLRVGTNAICAGTRSFLEELVAAGQLLQQNWYDFPDNPGKYPVMRQMLYDPANPVSTPYFMWFDDDSCLKTESGPNWLAGVLQQMQTNAYSLLGATYLWTWQGQQREWVRAQPWYAGKDPIARASAKFVTGGWWCAQTEMLHRFDYPWPVLKHNGGDVMLGELCFQQGLKVGHFNQDVAINADYSLRESNARRRGLHTVPIGVEPAVPKGDVMNLQEAIPALEARLGELRAAAAEFQNLRQVLQGETSAVTLYVSLANGGPQVPVSASWPAELREQLVAGLAATAQAAVLTATEALHQTAGELLAHCRSAVAEAAA